MTSYKLCAEVRSRIAGIVKDRGYTAAEVAGLVGCHVTNVRAAVARMCSDGLLFTCRATGVNGTQHELWVFGDMAQRDAFYAECQRRSAEKQRQYHKEYQRRIRARRAERVRLARAQAAEVRKALKAQEREETERREAAEKAARVEQRRREAELRRAEVEQRKERARLDREAAAARKQREKAEAKKTRERLKAETKAAGALVFKGGTDSPKAVKPRGPAMLPGEPVIPPGVEVQRLENNLTPQVKVQGGFSSLPPGYYTMPASSWVKAVAA